MSYQKQTQQNLEAFDNRTPVQVITNTVDAANLIQKQRILNGWVSVVDGFPSKSGDYLVLLRGERYRVMGFNPGNSTFVPSNMSQAVTHWTTLPPRPET